MAIGYPIIGQGFGDIANQIGYWDNRNRAVIEANMRRRAEQENALNNWFANVANMQRADESQNYQRALNERQRADVLGQGDIERQMRAYEFRSGQDFSREQNRLAQDVENARIAANLKQNELRQAEADTADKFNLIADMVSSGRKLAEFDTSGLKPLEIQRLNNLERDYARQTQEEIGIAQEGLGMLNQQLLAERRRRTFAERAGDEALDTDERKELEEQIRKLPVSELSLLDDEGLAAVTKGFKGLNANFFRLARFNPTTQQFEIRPQSWFNSAPAGAQPATAGATRDMGRIGRFQVTVE